MIDVDRVRQATEDVLGRRAYDELQPSFAESLVARVRGWFADLVDQVLGSSAISGVGVGVAVGLVVALVVAGLLLLWGLRRTRHGDTTVEVARGQDVGSLLVAADRARADGDLDRAVRQRYGALVLALVENGVVEGNPGLTVGDVDRRVGAALPTAARPVAQAGRRLADVVYGATPADAGADDAVVAALVAVGAATGRRDLGRRVGAATGGTAVPVGADGAAAS